MSLLHQLIRNLSASERKAARQWLACELHNQRADCRQLFDQLTSADPSAGSSTLFSRIYPGEAYKPAKYRQLEYQLLKRLEAYLTWETFRHHAQAPDTFLLHAYRQRGLDDHRQTRLRRHKPAPVASPERNRLAYLVAAEQYELDLRASRGGKVDYLQPEHRLETYVLSLRLRQAVTTLAHQRLHKTTDQYQIPQLAYLLEVAAVPHHQQDPFIALYALVLRLQTAEAPEQERIFTQLTQRIIAVSDQLPPADQRTVLIAAINYGLRHANSGYEPGIAATFTLYQLGLERRTLHHNGTLSIFAFNNILALALHLQQVDWATTFLQDYQDDLPGRGGSEVLALGQARLALARNDDGEALFLLQQADFKDFIHHLTARVMQLKIYFRQESYSLLHSHVSSTRKLLSRRKRVTYHLQNYRNIFQLADAIMRLPPGDERGRQQLAERIAKTEPCTERAWLTQALGLID